MRRLAHLLMGLAMLALAPAAFGETQAPAPAQSPPVEAGRDEVVVTGQLTRKMIYDFFRELDSDRICPQRFSMPRGRSCAELTYDVFDSAGKKLRRCNIPIFRAFEFGSGYVALTYRTFDCGNPKKGNKDLTFVPLEEVLNPRTKDGTVFKKVSVMGYYQAKDICETSKDKCVVDLFDHTRQLSFKALQMLSGPGPGVMKGGLNGHGH